MEIIGNANTFFFDWEVSLIEWLQNSLGSVGEAVSKAVTFIGGEAVMLVVLLVIMFCYNKEAGKRCGLTIVAGSMWFPMIKNIALRARPYMVHENVKALTIVEADANPMDIVQQGYSFPSGHSTNAVTMYGSLAREVKKKWMWIAAIVIPLLIGLSRFVVGVHYPTDVLAGWAVGLAAIGFGALLNKKVKKEWVRHLILLAVTLPGVFWCTSRDYFTSLGLMVGMVAVFPYEKKYINFSDTRNPWAMILRVAGAGAIYFLLNAVLKLPFSKEWLDSGTLGPNLVRALRYAIILFVIIGVWPRAFPLFEKIGKKK